MSSVRERPFDEELISGYLDGALTQQEAQRVRLYLEQSVEGKALFEEMKTLREATSSTEFLLPENNQWPELPQGHFSWLSRSLGWTLISLWLTIVTAYAPWKFFAHSADPFRIFLFLGLPGGLVLLFLSVLVERLRELKADRYRGVHR